MNEDIKILREALAKYAEFVEVDDGDPMEVPYRLYQKANTEYRQACDPDRIRRLLDDAERWHGLLQAIEEASSFQDTRWMDGDKIRADDLKAYVDGWRMTR